MKARWNVTTAENAAPRPHRSSRSGAAAGAARIAPSSEGRKFTTSTPRSLGRRMWMVLAIAGLAACSQAVPNIDAAPSGAATTPTSVPTLAAAPASCGEAVVPGGVDDIPGVRGGDGACPASCGEAVVPGGVDDIPGVRGGDGACPAPCRRAVVPGGVDDVPAVTPPSARVPAC